MCFKDPEDFVPKTFETMGNTMKVRTVESFPLFLFLGNITVLIYYFLYIFQMLHLMMILEILNPLFGYTKES
jgi:hypothetical protein